MMTPEAIELLLAKLRKDLEEASQVDVDTQFGLRYIYAENTPYAVAVEPNGTKTITIKINGGVFNS